MFRTISFTERLKLQVRAEAINAFNCANFGNPGVNISDAISDAGTFGIISSTDGAAHVLRLGLRTSYEALLCSVAQIPWATPLFQIGAWLYSRGALSRIP